MTTMLSTKSTPPRTPMQDVADACSRIAPTWPLDRFLAVNPLWGHVDRDVRTVTAELAVRSGATLLMPRAFHRARFRAGHVGEVHLERAIRAAGARCTTAELLAAMNSEPPAVVPLPTIADLANDERRPNEPQRWTDLVVHQISQHTAAWFDRTQSSWSAPRDGGLLRAWRDALAQDRGLPVREGHRRFAARVRVLPPEPQSCIEAAVAGLGLDAPQRRAWFDALLGSVRGWAAWCAYQRWQARLAGGDDDSIVHLLAMRAAWEWLLVEDLGLAGRLAAWRARIDEHSAQIARVERTQATDWLLQHALEIAFQERLAAGLRAHANEPPTRRTAPAAQAVFCIDVRSERFRRALEAASGTALETRGFAGFFGAPIDYAPLGTNTARPQLPGLLAPKLRATQGLTAAHGDATASIAERRLRSLAWRRRWRDFTRAAGSAFTFVESCGLAHGVNLLRNSLGRDPAGERAEDAGLRADDVAQLMPTWAPESAPRLADRIALAAGVLRAMSLVRNFAGLVLLAGHGSTSANNPHAKGLDCGACGGQTGEVNARLVAGLLNDPEVRRGLVAEGITIPATTWFVAGLHDTTTDDVRLFDTDRVPASHHGALERLRSWLGVAGERTRAERAPTLGLADLVSDPTALAEAIRRRATDWAQVRPEWGLADNAAFVVAPRARTRNLDLRGQVFLHDYEWRLDPDRATLTLIMTAPMVVTHWINFQYHASTADNRRFGSGNKVLHNVVGGSIGVFEGNGGDLRIGLPMQSLHDGAEWRHTPRRLSVFLEAPSDAIDGVIAAHEIVRNLVDNGWLFVFRIDDDGFTWERRPRGGWERTAP